MVAVGSLVAGRRAWAAVPTTAPAPTADDTAQIDTGDTKKTRVTLPRELTFRVRVLAIEPKREVKIDWRYGGEALGGLVYRGNIASGLPVGQWSAATPLTELIKGPWPPAFQGRYWYLTFTVNDAKSRGLRLEFEFSYHGKLLKTFTVAAPDGVTAGIVIPHCRLVDGREPIQAEFVAELGGLKEYAQRRADSVAGLPWAKGALPQKFAFVSDLGGYGEGIGYGVRHCDKAIVEAEMPTLRQLGVNTLRQAPEFLKQMARKHEGFAKDLGVAELGTAMGFPVPAFRKNNNKNDPESGCPFGSKVAERTKDAVAAAVAKNLAISVPEVWALTIDEIGSVFDHSAEGKKHMEVCTRCNEAFRQYVQSLGTTPADFGQTDWAAVKPAVDGGAGATSYYTRKFGNYATAKLFAELSKAFDAENARKREALAKGQTDTPVAKQPWIYSYALRGNTFLMAGHSLDFFDFYRYADNAFVYEMSNRGWQVWQWDSYLCDVGRVVNRELGKPLGVYVKPHRGAPVQRALTAVARGAKMIYWYTYGPDYFKGDSFCDNLESVALASKAAHLIGKTEDVLYGATWAAPAEVAIVKPRCSEVLGNDAQWENAKWVYTVLAHAHIPVDPIDEVMLAAGNLSRYRIIYVNGSHLPRRSAEALARYVENGGVLWTSGFGCARDEADAPLKALDPVLGLEARQPPELWYAVQRYKATDVQSFADARAVIVPVPDNARITGAGVYVGSFMPVVGREVLRPAAGTEVLARFADGRAAMTVHKHGKGLAYTAGFYAGLEYSATLRDGNIDMCRDLDAARRNFITAPALAVTRPVVEPSVPAVEAVLLRNPASGKHAVVLMNWAYKLSPTPQPSRKASAVTLAELTNVVVTIHSAAAFTTARSAMLEQALPIRRNGDAAQVTIPRLAEGDVLTLE